MDGENDRRMPTLAAVLLVVAAADDAGPPRVEQWGLAGFCEGLVSGVHVAALGGGGVRFALRHRPAGPAGPLPVGSVLAGAMVSDQRDWSGWLETRFELMRANDGGLLEPSLHAYLSSGVLVGRAYVAPLRGGDPLVGVRPYAGIGAGWNWTPEHGRFKLEVDKSAALLFALPLILAGRVELRLYPGFGAADYPELAFLTGFGF